MKYKPHSCTDRTVPSEMKHITNHRVEVQSFLPRKFTQKSHWPRTMDMMIGVIEYHVQDNQVRVCEKWALNHKSPRMDAYKRPVK